MDKSSKDQDILYCSFNQDQGCFSVGTQNGFKIFSANPLKETFSRDLGGGIGIVEMLYRCNILALVGGGNSPRYERNRVMLWDDHQTKCIAELTFRTDVKGVRLKSDKIIVVLESKIYVYNFSDVKLIDHIETAKNEKGLFCLTNDANVTILACPAKDVGHVALHFYDTKKQISFKAHQSQIGCMELDNSGKKLATASEKGTLIRIFSTEDGKLITELRRGSEYAQIFSISFDLESKWLAVSSDTCTVHVFSLQDMKNQENYEDKKAKNSKSKLSILKFVSSYFDSEWSFAQYKISDRRAKLAFGYSDGDSRNVCLNVIGYDGNFYSLSFDPVNGGECMKMLEKKIFDDK